MKTDPFYDWAHLEVEHLAGLRGADTNTEALHRILTLLESFEGEASIGYIADQLSLLVNNVPLTPLEDVPTQWVPDEQTGFAWHERCSAVVRISNLDATTEEDYWCAHTGKYRFEYNGEEVPGSVSSAEVDFPYHIETLDPLVIQTDSRGVPLFQIHAIHVEDYGLRVRYSSPTKLNYTTKLSDIVYNSLRGWLLKAEKVDSLLSEESAVEQTEQFSSSNASSSVEHLPSPSPVNSADR